MTMCPSNLFLGVIVFLVQVNQHLCQVEGFAGPLYYFAVEGFSFGWVQPKLRDVFYNGFGITFMERDRFIPGNVLYTENHSVKTLNPRTMESWLIAGDPELRGHREGTGTKARFNMPFSFYQLNQSTIIILDSGNHCFRTLSRHTNSTANFAGQCKTPGYIDGHFSVARFNASARILALTEKQILTTDTPNQCIRKLDLENQQVSTWKTIHNRTIIDMSYRPGFSDRFYITLGGALAQIDVITKELTFVTQSLWQGFKDGSLHTKAVLSDRPERIVFLDSNVMLIADKGNKMLRVASLGEAQTMTSICKSVTDNTTRAGEIDTCRLGFTRSLLALPEFNIILIGQGDALGSMEIQGLNNTRNSTWTLPVPPTSISAPTTTTPKHNSVTTRGPPMTARVPSTSPPTPGTDSDSNTKATMTAVQYSHVTLAPSVAVTPKPAEEDGVTDRQDGGVVHHHYYSESSPAAVSIVGVVTAGVIVLVLMSMVFVLYRKRINMKQSMHRSETSVTRTDETPNSRASVQRGDETANSSQGIVEGGPNMMRLKSLPRRPDTTAAHAAPENEYGQVTPQGGASGESTARDHASVGRYNRFVNESI